MKKLVVMACLLAGCEPDKTEYQEPTVPVVVIDGCEYFRCSTYGGAPVYTHKGNCKNPIHIHNGGNHD